MSVFGITSKQTNKQANIEDPTRPGKVPKSSCGKLSAVMSKRSRILALVCSAKGHKIDYPEAKINPIQTEREGASLQWIAIDGVEVRLNIRRATIHQHESQESELGTLQQRNGSSRNAIPR